MAHEIHSQSRMDRVTPSSQFCSLPRTSALRGASWHRIPATTTAHFGSLSKAWARKTCLLPNSTHHQVLPMTPQDTTIPLEDVLPPPSLPESQLRALPLSLARPFPQEGRARHPDPSLPTAQTQKYKAEQAMADADFCAGGAVWARCGCVLCQPA